MPHAIDEEEKKRCYVVAKVTRHIISMLNVVQGGGNLTNRQRQGSVPYLLT
jgi:hypothetical protein